MFAVHISVIASEVQTELKLSVNDISYLWPVPSTQAEVDSLIDGASVWPDPSFEAVLNMALGVRVKDGGGNTWQVRSRTEGPAKRKFILLCDTLLVAHSR